MAQNSLQSPRLQCWNHLFTTLNAAYHEAGCRLGISDCAMQILYAVCECGTARPLSEIVSITGISKQTINSALRRLEADGMITLELLNRRRKLVCLTEAGQALAQRTALRLAAVEKEIIEACSQEEWDQFIATSERYLQMFTEKIKEF